MAAAQLPALAWGAWQTPFVFFTGKGGVGKTTVRQCRAVALADGGQRVLVVSTDPASNLGDVFGTAVGPERRAVPGVPGLEVMNLDPDAAAAGYRERVIGPYRGVVSEEELEGIEEQLAGECTVEVAAFDQFTQLIVHPGIDRPLRPRALRHRADGSHAAIDEPAERVVAVHRSKPPRGPVAWARARDSQAQREQYSAAVAQLGDAQRTTLVLVSRPDAGALREAARAGAELAAQGIRNQRLVVNGLFSNPLAGDAVAEALAQRHARALESMPRGAARDARGGGAAGRTGPYRRHRASCAGFGPDAGRPRAADRRGPGGAAARSRMRWSTSWPPAPRAPCW